MIIFSLLATIAVILAVNAIAKRSSRSVEAKLWMITFSWIGLTVLWWLFYFSNLDS